MSKRCFQDSSANGPRKIDGERAIARCLDCSQCGVCEVQQRSPWPATAIADGCPLPPAPEEENPDFGKD